MAVILNAHELIAVAKDRDVDVSDVVDAVSRLAAVLAKQSGLKVESADEPGFGGFLIAFTAGSNSRCPEDLQRMGPTGELS